MIWFHGRMHNLTTFIKRFAVVASFVLLTTVGIGIAAPGGKKAIKIIAIGDSITEAYRVIPQTYRFHLAKLMDEKGIAYDFVGSKKGVLQNAGDGSVDLDHEGYSGLRADQVIPSALKTVQAEKPDVALVHLGTNDILMNQGVDNAMSDIETLVKGLKEANPKVEVFFALIPWKDNQQIEQLNTRLKAYVESDKMLHHVEMRPFELNTNYRDFPKYSLHPNEAGATIMAGKFFEAMDGNVFSKKPARAASGDVPLAQDRELRTWTSSKGTTMEARLQRTAGRGATAYLINAEGKPMQIPTAALSSADRDYVKGLIE